MSALTEFLSRPLIGTKPMAGQAEGAKRALYFHASSRPPDLSVGYATLSANITPNKPWTRDMLLGDNWFALPAQNDYVEYDFGLFAAGTYSVRLFGYGSPGYGISTVYVNGTSIGTMDWYNATTTAGLGPAALSFSLATDTTLKMRFSMLTKNASSTGYYFAPSAFAIKRTGA